MHLGTNNKNFFQKLGADQLEMTAENDLGQPGCDNRASLWKGHATEGCVWSSISSRER